MTSSYGIKGVNPVKVGIQGKRTWWMFRGEFYWEDEGYTAREVKALALERLRNKERRIQRAISLMEQEHLVSTAVREPIPDDVKILVWKRDGGQCVRCGSKERLEFDHIVPLSMGGSNTARNVQLLCESCNRSKGGSLV